MRRVIAIITACALILLAVLVIVVIGLAKQSASNTNTATLVQDVEQLLLNGKTASAKSAKKTAQEVRTLLALQAFGHAQTEAGTRTLQLVIQDVETHLDATIQRDVDAAALKVARSYGR